MYNVSITSTTSTTYEDNTSWVSYSFKNKHGDTVYSYEIVNNSILDDTNAIIDIINKNIPTKHVLDHLLLDDGIKDRFTDIIEGDNDMYYFEGYADFDYYFHAYDIDEIKTVVDRIKLNLAVLEQEGYVEYADVTDENLENSEPIVTIYGGAITRLIFR